MAGKYSVLYWGSHPDLNNDDCISGSDFTAPEDAIAAFKAEPSQVLSWMADTAPSHVELDGFEDSELADLGIERVRVNPIHVKSEDDDNEARRERAMQAGMGLGIQAYNEEMGYD